MDEWVVWFYVSEQGATPIVPHCSGSGPAPAHCPGTGHSKCDYKTAYFSKDFNLQKEGDQENDGYSGVNGTCDKIKYFGFKMKRP